MALRAILLVLALSIAAGAMVAAQEAPRPPVAAQAGDQARTPPAQAPREAPAVTIARDAAAENQQHALSVVVWTAGIFAIVSTAFLVFLVVIMRKSFWNEASKAGAESWRAQLMQLPLGVPEGSVRALISIFVIMFGLLVLVLQNQLGVRSVEAISGFVGIVITFYFTTRSGEQAQKTVEAARDAVSSANAAVAKVADDTKAQLANAASTLTGAAIQIAGPAAQSGAVATADESTPLQGKLREFRDRLSLVRQVASVASGLGVGTEILSGADTAMQTVDRLVGSIDPLLSGNPDPKAMSTVITSVGAALGPLENAGLPGAFADAIATLRGTLDAAGPIVAGIPGGPVGIVGGIVLAGVKLAQNAQQFEALKTALLRKPFDPALMSGISVDGNAATVALEMSPHIKAVLGGSPPVVATTLMREVLRRTPQGAPVPAADLAAELLANGLNAEGQVITLVDRVASVDELTAAIEEYRTSVVYGAARARLDGSIEVPAAGGQAATSIDLRTLTDAAQSLAGIPAAASQIERLVYLAEALGKLPNGSGAAVDLIGSALGMAQGLLPQRAQQQEAA